jgi:PadR family transcriptional regulator, regulatory protein PadR
MAGNHSRIVRRYLAVMRNVVFSLDDPTGPFRVTDATVDVIQALLSGEPDLYGLKIAREIGRPTGSIVPILMRLESCGWVTSEWEEANARGGPRRRFYRLHPDCLGQALELVATRSKPNRRQQVMGVPRLGLESGR